MLIYNTTYHVEEGEDKNFLIWMLPNCIVGIKSKE